MLSKFGVTVDKLPPGMTEFPMFPGMYFFRFQFICWKSFLIFSFSVLGIDPNRIIGKKCESMAIDIQIIKNDKIKRTWHFEDWAACLVNCVFQL